MKTILWSLVLVWGVLVIGCYGCGRQVAPTTPPPPVVEETISANTISRQDKGNSAWSTGGGIDWTHVGPSGQASGASGSSSSGATSAGNRLTNAAVPSNGRTSTPQSVSANQLRRLSEQLFNLDTNSVGEQITLNTQGRTSSSNAVDQAPQHLFNSLPTRTFQGPTIAALYALLDNYNPDVTARESDTQQETREIAAFLDAVTATPLMAAAETFLTEKGFINTPLRSVLQQIWFTTYHRSRRTLGSSGFEHVFVGEIKNGKVSGFHNWVSFYKEEQEGDLDYFGYMKTVNLGNKAKIITLKFNWIEDEKPVGSVFVGTSPELDMALYTICFFARQGNNCPMSLGGHRFNIKTHSQSYNGNKLIGSAYPSI